MRGCGVFRYLSITSPMEGLGSDPMSRRRRGMAFTKPPTDPWKIIQDTDLDALEEATKAGVDLSQTNDAGQNLFHHLAKCATLKYQNYFHVKPTSQYATVEGISRIYAGICLILRMNGANINRHDRQGRTPLHLAAARSTVELIQELLNRGARLNFNDKKNRTMLHYAALNRKDVFAFISSKIPRANLGYLQTDVNGMTPLSCALLHSNTEVAMHIISNTTVSLDHQDAFGRSYLHLAVWKCSPEVCKELMERLADPLTVDSRGRSILHYLMKVQIEEAAKLTRYSAVMELLTLENRKKLLNLKESTKGHTVLHMAVLRGHYQFVKKMLTDGADLLLDNSNLNAFHLAVAKGDQHTCRVFLSNVDPVKLAAPDSHGRSILHWLAAFGGNKAMEQLWRDEALLTADPSIWTKEKQFDDKGRTPLHIAAVKGNKAAIKAITKRLTEAVATTIADQRERTPLHLASRVGNSDVIRTLLDSGWPVDAVDWRHRTALMYAAQSGDGTAFNELLKKGADVEVRDTSNENAIEIAAKEGHVKPLALVIAAKKAFLPEVQTALEKKNTDNSESLMTRVKTLISNNASVDQILHPKSDDEDDELGESISARRQKESLDFRHFRSNNRRTRSARSGSMGSDSSSSSDATSRSGSDTASGTDDDDDDYDDVEPREDNSRKSLSLGSNLEYEDDSDDDSVVIHYSDTVVRDDSPASISVKKAIGASAKAPSFPPVRRKLTRSDPYQSDSDSDSSGSGSGSDSSGSDEDASERSSSSDSADKSRQEEAEKDFTSQLISRGGEKESPLAALGSPPLGDPKARKVDDYSSTDDGEGDLDWDDLDIDEIDEKTGKKIKGASPPAPSGTERGLPIMVAVKKTAAAKTSRSSPPPADDDSDFASDFSDAEAELKTNNGNTSAPTVIAAKKSAVSFGILPKRPPPSAPKKSPTPTPAQAKSDKADDAEDDWPEDLPSDKDKPAPVPKKQAVADDDDEDWDADFDEPARPPAKQLQPKAASSAADDDNWDDDFAEPPARTAAPPTKFTVPEIPPFSALVKGAAKTTTTPGGAVKGTISFEAFKEMQQQPQGQATNSPPVKAPEQEGAKKTSAAPAAGAKKTITPEMFSAMNAVAKTAGAAVKGTITPEMWAAANAAAAAAPVQPKRVVDLQHLEHGSHATARSPAGSTPPIPRRPSDPALMEKVIITDSISDDDDDWAKDSDDEDGAGAAVVQARKKALDEADSHHHAGKQKPEITAPSIPASLKSREAHSVGSHHGHHRQSAHMDSKSNPLHEGHHLINDASTPSRSKSYGSESDAHNFATPAPSSVRGPDAELEDALNAPATPAGTPVIVLPESRVIEMTKSQDSRTSDYLAMASLVDRMNRKLEDMERAHKVIKDIESVAETLVPVGNFASSEEAVAAYVNGLQSKLKLVQIGKSIDYLEEQLASQQRILAQEIALRNEARTQLEFKWEQYFRQQDIVRSQVRREVLQSNWSSRDLFTPLMLASHILGLIVLLVMGLSFVAN